MLEIAYTLNPGQLREGMNALAAELHQSAVTSSDLVIDLGLEGAKLREGGQSAAILRSTGSVRARTLHDGEWSALNEAAFIVGTPASPDTLAVSELLYKPLGGGDLEFVEVMNIADVEIELAGVRFDAGIDFEFPNGFALAPGARALVVDNRTAFEAAFGPRGDIAGEFGGDLDNGGETIALRASNGAVIRSFRYDDALPWPTGPDRGGYSLSLIAPERNPDHGDPLNWRASVVPGGSPGGSDSATFTGDPDDDRDADGWNALLEYALGGDDSDPGKGCRFEARSSPDGALRASFTKNLAADDVIVDLELSSDLGSWGVPSPPWLLISRENLGGGLARLTFEAPQHPGPAAFVRLRVRQR